ncbi:Pup--protein ligase [Bogoriella caseilytica]|uniref:Pup--protein ligase n=1 Tax=Bogoriella caseilytica TaxID=56055 RepID=A0A3N2B8U1_9MICO|nr:Pup--protein ligase [Bogoriella caseilytica]ROR71677.1 proteasome accessory factor A [Bogoriella caseilytica]
MTADGHGAEGTDAAGGSTPRRIYGIETEYGITCALPAGAPGAAISADDAARYLFRKVVAWGRSSNVFLPNGARLYLDVGSHPEYASAECDDLRQLVANDRAGELILDRMTEDANVLLAAEEVPGTIHLFKNNLDSAGNSYGCHENYLIRRRRDFQAVGEALVGYFVTRQILTGAGHIRPRPGGGATYAFSQRADQMWDAMSSATTRSRPVINTRDEPHADAEHYRRMHVIAGDTSVAETTTMLKVGMTDLLLGMIEDPAAGSGSVRDLALAEPMRAIREISRDLTATTAVELSDGRRVSALEYQSEIHERVRAWIDESGFTLSSSQERVVDLWERGLEALRTQDYDAVSTELDWAIKYRLIERYRAKHTLAWDDPRVARLSLAYHDISARHGLARPLAARGLMARVTTDDEVEAATNEPPATTRAALRGRFVAAAQARRRDITVDWVHLKLNDSAHRTVALKDPFSPVDERVEALLEAVEEPA